MFIYFKRIRSEELGRIAAAVEAMVVKYRLWEDYKLSVSATRSESMVLSCQINLLAGVLTVSDAFPVMRYLDRLASFTRLHAPRLVTPFA